MLEDELSFFVSFYAQNMNISEFSIPKLFVIEFIHIHETGITNPAKNPNQVPGG